MTAAKLLLLAAAALVPVVVSAVQLKDHSCFTSLDPATATRMDCENKGVTGECGYRVDHPRRVRPRRLHSRPSSALVDCLTHTQTPPACSSFWCAAATRTGTIPTEVGALTNLKQLAVSYNALGGSCVGDARACSLARAHHTAGPARNPRRVRPRRLHSRPSSALVDCLTHTQTTRSRASGSAPRNRTTCASLRRHT